MYVQRTNARERRRQVERNYVIIGASQFLDIEFSDHRRVIEDMKQPILTSILVHL